MVLGLREWTQGRRAGDRGPHTSDTPLTTARSPRHGSRPCVQAPGPVGPQHCSVRDCQGQEHIPASTWVSATELPLPWQLTGMWLGGACVIQGPRVFGPIIRPAQVPSAGSGLRLPLTHGTEGLSADQRLLELASRIGSRVPGNGSILGQQWSTQGCGGTACRGERGRVGERAGVGGVLCRRSTVRPGGTAHQEGRWWKEGTRET